MKKIVKEQENNEIDVNLKSLKADQEISFVDIEGEEHTGKVMEIIGDKVKVKSFDDNLIYRVNFSKIVGYTKAIEVIPTSEKQYTDKNNKVILPNQRCRAKVNNVWVRGTIISFKELSTEEYASVWIDDNPISKLINTADIIGVDEFVEDVKQPEMKGVEAKKKEIKEKKAEIEKIKKVVVVEEDSLISIEERPNVLTDDECYDLMSTVNDKLSPEQIQELAKNPTEIDNCEVLNDEEKQSLKEELVEEDVKPLWSVPPTETKEEVKKPTKPVKEAVSEKDKKVEIKEPEKQVEKSAGKVTKSDIIREALKAGKKPSDIAKELGCRLQFVYNIKGKL